MYLDGVPQAVTGTGTFNTSGAYIAVANLPGAEWNNYLTGNVDEFRISSVERSANYLATDFAAQKNTAFVSVGTPGTTITGPSTIYLSAGDAVTVNDTSAGFDAALHPSVMDRVTFGDVAAGYDATFQRTGVDQVSFAETAVAFGRVKGYDTLSFLDAASGRNVVHHASAHDTMTVLDTGTGHAPQEALLQRCR